MGIQSVTGYEFIGHGFAAPAKQLNWTLYGDVGFRLPQFRPERTVGVTDGQHGNPNKRLDMKSNYFRCPEEPDRFLPWLSANAPKSTLTKIHVQLNIP